MAKFAKYWEQYSGIFWGAIGGVVVWLLNPSYTDSIDLVKALPQLTTCIFGFLLTLLGIILQGDGPLIQNMKEATKVYNRFIGYNKKVVILSFVMTLFALLVGYIRYEWLHNFIVSVNPCMAVYIRRYALSFLAFGSVWLVVDLMIFVKLFYLLIKQSK